VSSMLGRLTRGSFLVLSHGTADFDGEGMLEKVRDIYRKGGTPLRLRDKDEILAFFDGLEMIDPGLTPTHRWRPDGPITITDEQSFIYAGVARKP
jgi:hypothetical protein